MTGFIAETTALLVRTPGVLRTLLIGLPEVWTETPDVADGWRPRDVVGHLITGEQPGWLPTPEALGPTRRYSVGTAPDRTWAV